MDNSFEKIAKNKIYIIDVFVYSIIDDHLFLFFSVVKLLVIQCYLTRVKQK